MKHALKFSGFVFLSLGAFAGCATDATLDSPASVSGDTELATEGDALTAAADRGYYIARRDVRRCAAPLCGGLWVKAVNQPTTRCSNGSRSAECYVYDATFGRVGLSAREAVDFQSSFADGRALVRASMTSTRISGRRVGRLDASEAWLGASGASPAGTTFFRAADNGLRCITTPCPTTGARPLNFGDGFNTLGVIVSNTIPTASAEDQNSALELAATRSGVLFAGGIQTPRCAPGARDCGPRAMAWEFYLPVKHTEGVYCGTRRSDTCGTGQYCAWSAGALCGAADAPGRCAYRPEVCIALYQPVCGCDGVTYGNACSAGSVGASILQDGACP